MSQVENLSIYFVLPSDDASEDDASSDMKLAHNMVVQYGANATWIPPSKCLKKAKSSKDVFVFEEFDGKAFEDLQKSPSRCIIVGTRCMLTCVSSGRSIPYYSTPIFSEGMRDLVVCCTGFDPSIKKQLQKKVEQMAGVYVKSLTTATTHLVAYNNISNKAFTAYKCNVPVMKKEWIDAVWEESKRLNVNGKDDQFTAFKSPLFHNLSVTTSGIGKREKDKIKELIETNGGTFTGAMAEKTTNVLIISKPEGEKFKFANLWKIDCVVPNWVYDCVHSKMVLPLKSYILECNKPKSSTPKKGEGNVSANFSMMSAIPQDPVMGMSHLEETDVTMSYNSGKSALQTQTQHQKATNPADNTSDIINNVLLKNLKDAGLFLDSCNIYLFGFSVEDMEKLKKILNVGGAARFDELHEFVTHVVVAKKTDIATASLKNTSAHILTLNWIVESMKLKRPAPESEFLVSRGGQRNTEPASPLSKLGAKLLSTVDANDMPQFSLEKEREKIVLMQEKIELLNKYKSTAPEEPLPHADKTLTTSSNLSLQSETDLTQQTEYFSGLTFFLSDELSEEEQRDLKDVIIDKGGTIVPQNHPEISDYAVVPICGASLSQVSTREVVNTFYIKDCCLEEGLSKMKYYHQPVACVKGATPLKNCVISVTNYIQCEREFIEALIEILGAVAQSLMARKPKDNNILKSTHLICSEPTGLKYNGAVRWGVPVVHHDWLLKCAALGIRVSERPYLIGDSKLSTTVNDTKENLSSRMATLPHDDKPPTTPSQGSISALSVQRKEVAPLSPSVSMSDNKKNDTALSKNNNETPLHTVVSRLKNSELNTNSPDSDRTLTPTSPYGAFYGNDNPSPNTRKRLWKWMHQGADFPLDPPMNYQLEPTKSDGTPLSTVLSKLLADMKRKPEDIPADSPISTTAKSVRHNEPDDAPEMPCKRLNLDEENAECLGSSERSIMAGLQKMKEMEENYTRVTVKPQTPVRKESKQLPPIMLESQPYTEVGWEDPNEKEIALKKLEMAAEAELLRKKGERNVAAERCKQDKSESKIFMLTRFSNAEDIAKLIEKCGGKVSTLPHFDKNATHLISKDLTRDEKLMSSIATGLWVLHPSYIEALESVRDVYSISEEDYEWGNPERLDRTVGLSNNSKDFAGCSRDWRLALRDGSDPPFFAMKFILHLRASKFDNFRRLIETGGGEVLNVKSPYRNVVGADMCIVDSGFTEEIDLEGLAKKNVPCVSILYVSDRILQKEDAVEKNLIPSFRKYWERRDE